MSETMTLHQVPEIMTLHRALWAGRMMSAFVVIALVADGTIQLFAPAQIASMLQETGFAIDLTRVVGPIILACAILYAIPATAVLGAILVTAFWEVPSAPMSALVSWDRRQKSFRWFWARWRGAASTRAISVSGPFCHSFVESTRAVLCP